MWVINIVSVNLLHVQFATFFYVSSCSIADYKRSPLKYSTQSSSQQTCIRIRKKICNGGKSFLALSVQIYGRRECGVETN